MHAACFVPWLIVVFGVLFIYLFYPPLPAASFRDCDDNHIRKTLLHVAAFFKNIKNIGMFPRWLFVDSPSLTANC